MLKSEKLHLRGRRRRKTRHRAALEKDSRKGRHLVSKCELEALNRVPTQGTIWGVGKKEETGGKKCKLRTTREK